MNAVLPIVTELAKYCLSNNLSLVTAESCTGGGVAYEITSMAGSSQWFDRGFITYSNEAKIEMLGVSKNSIEAYGAVSEEVAREMAEGALKHSAASLSLSITGIAGPEGGSAEKPVGTCWFAWGGRDFSTVSKMNLFGKDRFNIRTQAISFALEQLLQLISK